MFLLFLLVYLLLELKLRQILIFEIDERLVRVALAVATSCRSKSTPKLLYMQAGRTGALAGSVLDVAIVSSTMSFLEASK